MNVSKHKDNFCDEGGECRYRLNEGKFVHVSTVYIYVFSQSHFGVCCVTSYWYFSCRSI